MNDTRPAFRELCFVLMPFGEKQDSAGRVLQFNAIYDKLIAPAIREAGLEPVRGDEEVQGGMIHKQIFERLMLCPYAVADLTTANANVFYEVGVRHTALPHTTVLIHSNESDLKFDIHNLRSLRYGLDEKGQLEDLEKDKAALTRMLRAAQDPVDDSPLFELFKGKYQAPALPHEVADTFLDRVRYTEDVRRELGELRREYKRKISGETKEQRAARSEGIREKVRAIEARVQEHGAADAGTLTGIMMGYRATDAHEDMVRIAEAMPRHLHSTKVVQEQLGFALNRLGRRGDAMEVLRSVIDRFGVNPESNGLLGRVYKDLWNDAVKAGEDAEAEAYLNQAIGTYLRGFEADWRDYYPGVNAVTLMDIAGDERRERILPVVRYSTERRIAALPPERQDYWEHATMLELEALAGNSREATKWRLSAIGIAPESWYLTTTADNLEKIAARRRDSGRTDVATWIQNEADALRARA